MTLRIMLCGGGTGGHVYPLLAVRAALQDLQPVPAGGRPAPAASPAEGIADRAAVSDTVRIRPEGGIDWLFVGGDGIEKDLVERESLPYLAIRGGGLHGVGFRRTLVNLLQLVLGTEQAMQALAKFRPQVIVATGGFITVPVAIAAAARRTPMLVYLPDIEPAVSVRFLGRLARCITATAEASRKYFDARKFIVTGYPVRKELLAAAALPQAVARQKFGIGADGRVLLVSGGSRGARSLNRAVTQNAERLCKSVELIHISGAGEWAEVSAARSGMTAETQARYHAYPYLHDEMAHALAAADLVVSRAGASVLGELPLFGLPSVLVPYPHAWRYQKVNADYLAGKGAAIVLEDASLPSQLAPSVERLLQDDTAWDAMKRAARQLALPNAAASIARAVMGLC